MDLDRENGTLQDAESQKQDAKERLEEMDQQRSKLEGMLNDVKVKCQDESQTVRGSRLLIRPPLEAGCMNGGLCGGSIWENVGYPCTIREH